MSTGNENLDLLIKLLGLTQSSNDNEALLAARKANEQVKKFNTTWEDILKGRVKVVQDPFARPGPQVQSRPAPSAPPPRPNPRPTPPPRPVMSLHFLDLQGLYIGPFNSGADAQAFNSSHRIRATYVALITRPFSYQTPFQFESDIRRKKDREAREAQRQANLRANAANATAAGPMAHGITNKYEGKCYTCSRVIPAGKGFLSHKLGDGRMAIICGTDFGHNAKYQQRGPRPNAKIDDLDDLLF